jgi:hypothetical protein
MKDGTGFGFGGMGVIFPGSSVPGYRGVSQVPFYRLEIGPG